MILAEKERKNELLKVSFLSRDFNSELKEKLEQKQIERIKEKGPECKRE